MVRSGPYQRIFSMCRLLDKVFRKLKAGLSIRISLTLDAEALCVIDTLKDFGKKFSQY